jgi:DNA polymerase III delta prime subunit
MIIHIIEYYMNHVTKNLPGKVDKISLIDKYKPKKTNQLIGHRNEITAIISWLNNFKSEKPSDIHPIEKKRKYTKTDNTHLLEENDDELGIDVPVISANNKVKKSCLLVTGEHGIGKTCLIDVIINEYGYQKVIVDFLNLENLKDSKDMTNYLEKIVLNTNILNTMNSVKKKDIVIVIDEVESISALKEKNCVMTLLKMNEEKWYCPIILISNNQHNKFLSEIKKNSNEVKLFYPAFDEVEYCVGKILKKENINIKDPKAIEKLIEHSQKDIRRLIQLIDDIKYTFGDTAKEITLDVMCEYCNLSKMKDVDFNLFSATSNLLYKYKNIDDCLRYYETGKVLLPLMIHFNYLSSVKYSNATTYKTITKIADSLSNGDVIENYIYGDQNWDISEVHGIYTCVLPSFYMTKLIGKTTFKEYPKFTTDLNKTSIMKINRKNVLNANQCFTNSTITDYLFMIQILRNLIQNKRTDECVKLLKNYNIKLDQLESLLKIDKIENEYATKKPLLLTSKQRKDLQSVFSE